MPTLLEGVACPRPSTIWCVRYLWTVKTLQPKQVSVKQLLAEVRYFRVHASIGRPPKLGSKTDPLLAGHRPSLRPFPSSIDPSTPTWSSQSTTALGPCPPRSSQSLPLPLPLPLAPTTVMAFLFSFPGSRVQRVEGGGRG